MSAYDKVMAARDANKITTVDYINHMFGDSFLNCTATGDIPTIRQLWQALLCSMICL